MFNQVACEETTRHNCKCGSIIEIHADEISESEWHYSVNLNLNVPFLVSQKFVPKMKNAGWGRIINIASMQSTRAFENGISYGAAKGGILQLTRAMAEAWSKHGIMVNAIAPVFFLLS